MSNGNSAGIIQWIEHKEPENDDMASREAYENNTISIANKIK